jgi:hypothetical protein
MNTKHIVLVAMLSTVLSACSSVNEEVSERSDLPTWILSPSIDDGIAATDCVIYSGNLSVDRKMATANSRVTLAQQITLNVDSLDKAYLNRVNASQDATTGATFSSAAKLLTRQTLNGSRVIKADLVEIKDVEHFCVLTALSPKLTNDLYNDIVKNSKRELSDNDDKFLRQEFKAFKANRALELELAK